MKILHKKLGLLLCVALCVVCLAAVGSSAVAANASDIESYINEFEGYGASSGALSAEDNLDGSVTISGKGVKLTTTVELEMDDVEVIWEAEVAPDSSAPPTLIELSGDGTFEVADGANIAATGVVNAIEVAEASEEGVVENTLDASTDSYIEIIVSSGGKVSAENGTAIDASNFDIPCKVIVKGGEVKTTGSFGNAIISNSSDSEIIVASGTVKATGTNGTAIVACGYLEVTGGVVSATGENGDAILTYGDVEVSGGLVSAVGSYAIYAYGHYSNVTVNGGTVSAETKYAIYAYYDSCSVTISDGEVIATTGTAIYANCDVEVSGGTVSATTGNAIYSLGNVTVKGGTVSTTGGSSSYAIYSLGNVYIEGGFISATDGYAIYIGETVASSFIVSNGYSGYTRVTGGCVFAYGSKLTQVINDYSSSSGSLTVPTSGNGIVIAWDKPTKGSTYTYTEDTYTDLLSDPSKSADWYIISKGSKYSIYYKNGSNYGYIDLTAEGVKVVTSDDADSDADTVYYSTSGSSALSDYLDSYGTWKNPYEDVTTGDWFYDDVMYVSVYGFFNGTSATTFSPYDNMTRGMFVTVLGRMAGINTAMYSTSSFGDVDSGKYYAPYISWASAAGVVEGFEDGTFRPDATITREQMAAMICRFAAYYGVDTTVTTSLSFSDSDSISDWAKEGATFCQGKGIITGKTDNKFDPKGIATRAETAAMLHRLASWLYN